MNGTVDDAPVVLVTGASSGIGKAIAEKLLHEGFRVVVAARSLDKMTDLAADGARLIALDLTSDHSIRAAADNLLANEGRVDVLVNNAGYAVYGAVEDTDIADARRQFDVNLFGPALLTALLLPSMRERGSGRIINISSVGGEIHTLLGAWYHASKHALEAWSDTLRVETMRFGIRVVIIRPGFIDTSSFTDTMVGPMMERSGSSAYARHAKRMNRAVGRIYHNGLASQPTVVAKAVHKAATVKRPKTRYVVGAFAWPLIIARRLLGDRLFDQMVNAAG